MQVLQGLYESSSDDERTIKRSKIDSVKQKVDAAPLVVADLNSEASVALTSKATTMIDYNIPYSQLAQPMQGPKNPYAVVSTQRNVMSGFVEEHSMNPVMFKKLARTFDQLGYTLDPNAASEDQVVGDLSKASENHNKFVDELPKKSSKKRISANDPASDTYLGPWAGFEGEVLSLPDRDGPNEFNQPDLSVKVDRTKMDDLVETLEKTLFHGDSELDYLGRSFMHPPTDIDVNLLGEGGSQNCFIPKRLLQTWTGHTKGVNCIRFIPKTAHLILSGSLDTKIKIWDCYRERKCLRTYMGHSKSVRDLSFANPGTKFVSAGFDRFIKEWDTETGQCINRFSMKKLPYCVTYHPDPDMSHTFMVGSQDKKIHQFDTRAGGVVKEYDQHAGAINSITFVDENRRFITSSDDKSMRAWEFGIPMVLKYVSDPESASMPSVTLSHDQKWLSCQGLDNSIQIFSAIDRFRQNRKKVFKGHLTAGYACQTGISPDGRFVFSGDSAGMVWFWDWKTCKMNRKFKAHDGVVMGALWHPHETSRLATCSWDGTIKYWD